MDGTLGSDRIDDAVADDELRRRFRAARRDPELTVLEGFHALKHALRFGAGVETAVAVDPDELERLAADLAPDLAGRFGPEVRAIDADELAELVPQAPRTGVVAIARRKRADLGAALADRRDAPVVLLEQPRNMGNLGACVRVAAADGRVALPMRDGVSSLNLATSVAAVLYALRLQRPPR